LGKRKWKGKGKWEEREGIAGGEEGRGKRRGGVRGRGFAP